MSWRHDLPDAWNDLLSQLRAPSISSSALTLPTAHASVLPYRLRPSTSATLTPLLCWILYREADGTRALSAEFTPASFASPVTVDAPATLPDSRVLVVELPSSAAPELTYKEATAAHLVVEDILIAFQT